MIAEVLLCDICCAQCTAPSNPITWLSLPYSSADDKRDPEFPEHLSRLNSSSGEGRDFIWTECGLFICPIKVPLHQHLNILEPSVLKKMIKSSPASLPSPSWHCPPPLLFTLQPSVFLIPWLHFLTSLSSACSKTSDHSKNCVVGLIRWPVTAMLNLAAIFQFATI